MKPTAIAALAGITASAVLVGLKLTNRRLVDFAPGNASLPYIEELAQVRKSGKWNSQAPDQSQRIEWDYVWPKFLNLNCFNVALVNQAGDRKTIVRAAGASGAGLSAGWSKDSKAVFLHGENVAINCKTPLRPVSIIYVPATDTATEVVLK